MERVTKGEREAFRKATDWLSPEELEIFFELADIARPGFLHEQSDRPALCRLASLERKVRDGSITPAESEMHMKFLIALGFTPLSARLTLRNQPTQNDYNFLMQCIDEVM